MSCTMGTIISYFSYVYFQRNQGTIKKKQRRKKNGTVLGGKKKRNNILLNIDISENFCK